MAAEVATVALPPRAFQPRVAAPARTSTSSRLLGGAGLGGWDMFSSLEHLSQLESLAHARLCGMEIGGAGLGAGLCASNLAALSAGLRAGLSAPQLSAGFGGQVSAAAFSAVASAAAPGGGGHELLGSGYLGGDGGGGGGNGGGRGGGRGGGGGDCGFFGQQCGTLQGLRMSGIPSKDISTGGVSSISQSNLELEMQ